MLEGFRRQIEDSKLRYLDKIHEIQSYASDCLWAHHDVTRSRGIIFL